MKPFWLCVAISVASLCTSICQTSLCVEGIQPKFPLPQSKYKVRLERSHMVPMRDGVRLSTDFYFPEGAGNALAAILIRTPYNKNSYQRDRSPTYIFAGQGYVVAVQDVRAKFESEGREYIVSAADTQDGDDAINWLASQPWSNGKVGTFGCSYSGENQMDTAKLKNPHLKAMIPQAGGGAYRFAGLVQGGVIELAEASNWFIRNGSKIRPSLPADVPREQFILAAKHFSLSSVPPEIDWRALWRTLPTIDIVKSSGVPPTDWEGFISHGPADPWWDQFGYVNDSHHFNVPALFVDSWYDYGPADTLRLLNLLQRHGGSQQARQNQFAIIAPVTHCQYDKCSAQTIVGQRELGDSQFDFYGTYLAWFDFWLRGIENGVTQHPKIQLFVMGKNQWRGEQEWPLARAQWTRYYLHSDGRANSRFGTGLLNTVVPKEEVPDRYTYDPQSPVPTVGGPDLVGATAGMTVGGQDQADVEIRQDVLVYTTSPLDRGTEVTGPLEAVFYVSSSVRDTDFTVKLVDVYPDGKAYNIHEGILRARYRQGFDKKVWMTKGEIYEVKIDLQVTSNYFGAGHRIRLEVSSSNFPRFERNLNTGGNNYDETAWKVAENVVHHDKDHPSYLMLPIIPE